MFVYDVVFRNFGVVSLGQIFVSPDMGAAATKNAGGWLKLDEYPFEPKRLSVEGGRIHYVDEGTGPVIVFVHGTQTWSFLFRHLIHDLMRDFRCVAIDHLGFGLSDKPESMAGTPAQHARNLTRLIEFLDLKNITFVGHDCGAPIAVAYTEAHPINVERIVFMNTWLWSLEKDETARRHCRFVSTSIGKFMYVHADLASKYVKPLFHDKNKFTDPVHDAYSGPFHDHKHREGPLKLSESLMSESSWFEDLWANRDELQDIPKLLLWGAQDPTFGEPFMNRMWAGFPLAEVEKLTDCGHFPPEECPDLCSARIRQFMQVKSLNRADNP